MYMKYNHVNTYNYMYRYQSNVFPVLLDPPKFTNVSNNTMLLEGHKLQLFCIASGRPTPTINWVKVLSDGSESIVLPMNVTWNIINISRTDSGTYRCTANNGVGNPVSHTLRVNVKCKYMNCVQL